MVIDRRGATLLAGRVDDVVAELGLEVVPITLEQASLARRAYQDLGRGNHPSRSNSGKRLAYALANLAGDALLLKLQRFMQSRCRTCAEAVDA